MSAQQLYQYRRHLNSRVSQGLYGWHPLLLIPSGAQSFLSEHPGSRDWYRSLSKPCIRSAGVGSLPLPANYGARLPAISQCPVRLPRAALMPYPDVHWRQASWRCLWQPRRLTEVKMQKSAPYYQRLLALRAKGGIMFFSIQGPNRLYKGTVMLSPIENYCQRRAVYIREYRYKDEAKI